MMLTGGPSHPLLLLSTARQLILLLVYCSSAELQFSRNNRGQYILQLKKNVKCQLKTAENQKYSNVLLSCHKCHAVIYVIGQMVNVVVVVGEIGHDAFWTSISTPL